MDAQVAAVHRDSEAASAEFSDSVADAAAEARDRAKATADPIDPDGEYAAWIATMASNVAPSIALEIRGLTAAAWERIDREMAETEAELAVRHVSAFADRADFEAYERAITDSNGNFDNEGSGRYLELLQGRGFDLDRFIAQMDRFREAWFQTRLAFSAASRFVGDVLWQVAATVEWDLSQRVLAGQQVTASDAADLAEASARDIWASMRERSDAPENYRDDVATAILDAARVLGREVLDSPGPLVEIAAGRVERIADIEASPLAEEIRDTSAELRRTQAQVDDACEQ